MINVVRKVGRGVRARCPVCDRVASHLPANMAGGSASARCGRCGHVHVPRPVSDRAVSGEEPGARGAPPPPHRRRVPDAVEQQWQDEVAAQGPDAAVSYRATAVLAAGQLVDHPTFGLGRVRKLIPPATAEVHFQDGFKRLRCRL